MSLSILRFVIRTSVLAGLLSLVGAPLSAQTKPSEEVIVKAVRTNVRTDPDMTVGMVAMAAGAGFGQVKVNVETVEVLRFGTWNSQERYWPVEVCLRGTAQNTTFGSFGTPAPVKRINAKVRYRFQVDDFGEWSFEEVRPSRNATVGSLMCDALSPDQSVRNEPPVTPSPSSDGKPAVPATREGGGGRSAPSDADEAALQKQVSLHQSARQHFIVRHAHGAGGFIVTGDRWASCRGVLFVFADRLEFAPVSANDTSMHPLTIAGSAIAEVGTNRWPIGSYRAFHVRVQGGENLNFVPIEDRDVVVRALKEVFGERKSR